jgi:hypothetical protein
MFSEYHYRSAQAFFGRVGLEFTSRIEFETDIPPGLLFLDFPRSLPGPQDGVDDDTNLH